VSQREITSASELTPAAVAVETWLGKLHTAFDEWRRRQNVAESAEDLWQDVLQWYSAFDLSFAQLAQQLEDLGDLSDAMFALEADGQPTHTGGVRLSPLAHQRLRALSPELYEHLLGTHLPRLFAATPVPGVEWIKGMPGLRRIRAHGCRVVYHVDQHGPLILAVTMGYWRPPHAERSQESATTGRS
jgi:hypothetical protein